MQAEDNDTFDFQKELLQLLIEETDNNDCVCLISNQPLEESSIKLCCGHKFNYDSIFNDLDVITPKQIKHSESSRHLYIIRILILQ